MTPLRLPLLHLGAAEADRTGAAAAFDLCYFDGGHTWDDTGFGFLLVDMLLRPGGVISSTTWTGPSPAPPPTRATPAKAATYSPDEAEARSVERVWDLLVPERGYARLERIDKIQWGVARKPG